MMQRREFLALATGGGAAWLAGLSPADAASSGLAYSNLGDWLGLVTGGSAPVVVAQAGKALLLVDGSDAQGARALQGLLHRQFPGGRVTTLFNTHWHLERTGANRLFAGQGAQVIAHENTRLWLQVMQRQAVAALPNLTFFQGSKSVDFGGQQVAYGLLPQAHTDGDLFVHFPRQDVIVAGDIVSGDRWPELDVDSKGWLGGMLLALKSLAGRCGEGTRVIGATGQVLGRADIRAQQEMCFDLLTRIGQSYYKGETWAQFQASNPLGGHAAKSGDPGRFLRAAYDGAWHHVNEIRRPGRQEWVG